MRGKVLEGATLHDNRLRTKKSSVHVEKRNQIQQRAIAGDSRYVNVNLGEHLPQIERGSSIKGIQHFESDIGVFLACEFDAVRTDIGTYHYFAVARDEGCCGAALTASLQDNVVLVHPHRNRLMVFLNTKRSNELRSQLELFFVRHDPLHHPLTEHAGVGFLRSHSNGQRRLSFGGD